MRPFLEGWIGNPSAPHALGEEARESLAAARSKVGRLVGGRPEGIVFTGGATEANNLAVKGVALRGPGRHVVTTTVEHASVLAPCRDLVKAGFEVTVLPVDREGRVEPDAVREALRPDTCLVTAGAASQEVGTVQPWRDIAAVTRAAGVPLHVDGVGVVGRLPLAADADGIDLLTLGANDLYGPPGVGALWVRPGVRLLPQTLGGGQEEGLRSGTENLPGVVGLGVAAELVARGGPPRRSADEPPGPADRRSGGSLPDGATDRAEARTPASPRQPGRIRRERREPGTGPGRRGRLGLHGLGVRGPDP
jgi:cysteine desulfurase